MIDLYASAIVLLAILNFCMALYFWNNAKSSASITAGLFLFAVSEICIMFDLLMRASSPETAYAYARLRFLGLACLNPLLLIFVLQYTRQTQWLRPKFIAALFIIPIITQIVLWFSPAHAQFFLEWNVVRVDNYWVEVRKLGGWYYIHALSGGILLVLSVMMLAWYTRNVDSTRLRNLYIFLILIGLTVFGMTTSVLIGHAPGLNLTPLMLGVTSLLLGITFATGEAGHVMPIAYDVVFSSIDDAVFVLDTRSRIIKINPAVETIMNRPRSSLIGEQITTVLGGLEGWKTATDGKAFRVIIPAEKSPLIYEIRQMSLKYRGKRLGELIVMRDVTAQQKALELAIEQERGQLIANFINDASHEFRTPLSIIKSSAYLLSRNASPEKNALHFEKINDHADRISALVNDLQLMAALDSDHQIERAPVDIRRLIMTVAEGFARPQAALRKQTLTVDIAENLSVHPGNDHELTIALQKILHNAIRYTPECGTIHLAVQPDRGGVTISVTDNGVGMDEQTAQAAFRRFYRLDVARSIPGFGLGLPIAQKVAERHGGTVSIASKPNEGTTITMHLP